MLLLLELIEKFQHLSFLFVYISPKIPANVFRRFFIVSSVSSVMDCDWLPCLWNGRGGGSGSRPVVVGAPPLIVLVCDAAQKVIDIKHNINKKNEIKFLYII